VVAKPLINSVTVRVDALMAPLVAKQLIDDVIVRVDGAENVGKFFRQLTPNLLSHQTLSCLGR
jgi:hypothetical protein